MTIICGDHLGTHAAVSGSSTSSQGFDHPDEDMAGWELRVAKNPKFGKVRELGMDLQGTSEGKVPPPWGGLSGPQPFPPGIPGPTSALGPLSLQ